jgi:hypothetical protein
MGRRLGRPDISRYADRFDVPASDGGLAVTFLGVASLRVSDGTSAVLTDGFSRGPPCPECCCAASLPIPPFRKRSAGRGAGLSTPSCRYTPTTTTPWTPQPSPPPRGRACSAGPRPHRSASAVDCPGTGSRSSRRAGPLRPVHPDAGRVGPLPTRPVPRCHRAPCRAAGAGVGIPLRRGVVDPPRARQRPHRPDPGQRGVRPRRAHRPRGRRRLPRCRPTRPSGSRLHPRVLAGDGPGRGRPPGGAHPSKRRSSIRCPAYPLECSNFRACQRWLPVGGVDYPRTYQEFKAWFADDAACREYLGKLRWPDGFICPDCGCGGGWRTGKGLWMCPECGKKTSVSA